MMAGDKRRRTILAVAVCSGNIEMFMIVLSALGELLSEEEVRKAALFSFCG